MLYIFICILLSNLPSAAQAQILRVKNDATGLNDGTSWSNAFHSLNAALLQADYGDTIWVGQGVYYPTNDGNRDSSFILKNGVCVFGGFQGTESALWQRNINQFPVILSGDIGSAGDSTDNCYNVLFGSNVDSTTIIDGVIIERGCANSMMVVEPKLNRKRGGGVYLRPKAAGFSAAPVFQNCIFRNNYCIVTGQAIYAEEIQSSQSNVRLHHCRFMNNAGQGACVKAMSRKKAIKITNCYFGDNGNANLDISNSIGPNIIIIEEDTFRSPKGTVPFIETIYGPNFLNTFIINSVFISNSYGNIFVSSDGYDGQLTFSGCKFANNNMSIFVGLSNFLFKENEVVSNDRWEVNLTEFNQFSIFSNNYFLNSKIIVNSKTSLSFFNNKFIKNTTSLLLGGLNTTFFASNCLFYKNTGPIIRKLVYPVLVPCDLRFQSCSFINCETGNDTTHLFYSSNRDSITFNSCLFTKTPDILSMIDHINSPGQYISAINCVFEDPTCGKVLPAATSDLCNSTNTFGAELMFYDAEGGDFRLRPCSPGINTGDVEAINAAGITADLGGMPRVSNGVPDAGAYETVLSLSRDSVLDATCHGKSDGSILYSDDACPPYIYNWLNDAGLSGNQVNMLTAGQYWVTITGNYGITLFDTVTITEPPVPWNFTSATTPATSASSNNGSIATAVFDGNGPFQYKWSDGSVLPFIENVSPGVYGLTVTDVNGCTASYSFELGTVSLYEVPKSKTKVIPNPVSAGNFIQLYGVEKGTLVLTDITGRASGIFHVNSGVVLIPSSIVPGIYQGIVTDLNNRKTVCLIGVY